MEFLDIVEKIEKRRDELKESDIVLDIVDYGAGKADEKRTKEQMKKGVELKVALSDFATIGVKKEKALQIYEIFQTLNPKTILELGTCCGFSSSYMAHFLPECKIYTIEGSESLAKVARENHKFFNLENIEVIEGRFDAILDGVLDRISPIDFAFIDGHHNKEATLEYFKTILPFMSGGGVMLFDDISWNDSMKEAWREILDSSVYESYTDYSWMGAIWL
ncbi:MULTISPECIES: O-methyltransferase [Helicobacter]|uniref:Class I SAM-dependent methyltransferase n=1 Tax=Helicobacter ibis TaxID=2962633 RepID=A0ABT4VE57_9HELI|nr:MULTISPECIES: class I SAM-dependent methyltransferase [Helicobacter]MDA3967583.1 class I SAM-dependent methyltransferase [Helicobacter sp. WB40]MDA3968336.1 class I SAM-dependent methyltransferase [Helicobacter ibis]